MRNDVPGIKVQRRRETALRRKRKVGFTTGFIFLCLVFFLTNNVFSETEPVNPPKRTWKANIDAGITVQSGNTEATTATLKGAYANERKRDNIYFDAIALYQENDNELVANEQRATGKYEYKHTPRLYSFFNQYLEHDDTERLNYRSITSPGAGYRFIEKELIKYRAEAGPAFIYERFWLQPGPGHDTRESMSVRVGQYFDWQFLPMTKFYAKNEFVQSVENKDDWWMNSSVGVRQSITEKISLNFDWLDVYDNSPSEGKKRNDSTVIATLGYNF